MTLKSILLAAVLISSNVQAASFFCSEAEQIQYKGVNCCVSSIGEALCRQKINELSLQTIERIALVKSLIAQKKYQDGAFPNCHWSALYEQGISEATANIAYMYPEVQPILTRDFVEVAKADLKKGDLVAVVFITSMREYNDETRRTEWSVVGLDTAHSSLYIGDNMVFQKENAGNSDFSIQNMDEMLVSFQESYNSKPQLMRGVGSLKFYRKK